MTPQSMHLNTGTAKPQTAKEIEATGKVQTELLRTWAGAILVGALTIGYFVTLYAGKPEPSVLALVGSGMGYLLGASRHGGRV